MKVKPIVTGVLRKVHKVQEKGLEQSKIRGRMKTFRSNRLLKTGKMLERVMQIIKRHKKNRYTV